MASPKPGGPTRGSQTQGSSTQGDPTNGPADPTDSQVTGPERRPRTWAEDLRCALRYGTMFVIIVAYLFAAWTLLAWEPIQGDSFLEVASWYAAFMARTFRFHAGLAVSVLALVLLLCRCWKLFLFTLPVCGALAGDAAWQFAVRATRTPPPMIASAQDGEMLRIVSANLLFTCRDTVPLVERIKARDADVIVLIEYAPHWHEAFSKALAGDYPFRVEDPMPGAFGAAIYSRHPFVSEPQARTAPSMGKFSAPRVVIQFEDRPVTIQAMHLYPPMFGHIRFMRSQFQALLTAVPNDVSAGEAYVLAGDFNFTPDSAMYHALRTGGLRNSMEAAGSGFSGSWPNVRSAFFRPLMIPIDHVFYTGSMRCRASVTADAPGSDHRFVVADLEWAD